MMQDRFDRRRRSLARRAPGFVTAFAFLTAVGCGVFSHDTGSGTGPGTGQTSVGGGNSGGVSGSTGSGNGSGSGSTPVTQFDGGEQVTDGAAPDVVKAACGDSTYSDAFTPGYTQDPAVLQRVQTTIQAMTLANQEDQMRGETPGQFTDFFRTPDVNTSSVQVHGLWFRDGPRGVCVVAPETNGMFSTAFPVASGRAASFDLALEEQVGEAIGDETLATHNNVVLAPVINILRHPAWGRSQETYGEDPYLLGRFGSAFVTGVQKYTAACVKHYAANNIEDGRASANAVMIGPSGTATDGERTLREMYTRHFGDVVRDGGVACVMASYNEVNGTHSTDSPHLLTDILRTDFGFKGFIMSDWWAAYPHTANGNVTENSTNASVFQGFAVTSVKAGLNVEMPWAMLYSNIDSDISANQIGAGDVAKLASSILEQKYRFKIDPITGNGGLKTPTTTFDGTTVQNNDAHVALSEQAALESMVLLKNDAGTLPISASKVHTVAVVGEMAPYTLSTAAGGGGGTINFATDVRLGDEGSSRVHSETAKSIGPFAGIQAAAPSGVTVVTGSSSDGTVPSVASSADFIVVVAGLTPLDEGEEYTGAGDRDSFALDDKNKTNFQNNLITNVAKLGKPMVVVLEGGSVIDMPWLSQVPAVVMAWYPGQHGGAALGKLLFGAANFSGKLPITWPKAFADEPPFPSGTAGVTTSVTANMNYYVGYSWFDHNGTAPLFPFGSGLSYTTFRYDFLVVPCSTATANAVVDVSAGITNTGSVAGDEIAFLFVSYPNAPDRPVKELKSFHRVTLNPGESKTISLPIRMSDLRYWDMTSSSWKVASGTYKVMVGSSAGTLPLTDSFTVQ
jgi:beta-glucosidase